MKPILKLACLLTLCAIMFSCKKETKTNLQDDRMAALAAKYHLTKVEGGNLNNVRKIESLDEFEALLELRSKKKTIKTQGSIIKETKKPTASAQEQVEGNPTQGGYYATLQFDDFIQERYPDRIRLFWAAYVESGVSFNNGTRPEYLIGYDYIQQYGTNEGYDNSGTINVEGEYIEQYWYSSTVYEAKYRLELSASWTYPTISANAVYYPK